MKFVKFFSIAAVALLISGCGSDTKKKFVDDTMPQEEITHIVKGKLADINESNQDVVLSSALNMFTIDQSIENGVNARLTNDAIDTLDTNRAIKLAISKRETSYDCTKGKATVDDHGNGENKDVDVKFENCEFYNGLIYDGVIHYNSVVDEKHMDANFHNFKISLKDKVVFFENADLKLDGDKSYVKLTGYAKDGNKSSQFKDFVINEEKNLDIINFNANGSLATSCINNEWLDINTTKTIEQNITKDCPEAGTVEIKGKNDTLTIKYKSDESIDIYLDGNITRTYNSCEEMAEDAGSECEK